MDACGTLTSSLAEEKQDTGAVRNIGDNVVITGDDRREIKAHGTAGFPCAAYDNRMQGLPSEEVPWHWHEELEVQYARKGEAELKVISNTIPLHEGELTLVNANALHAVKPLGPCVIQSFVFSPRLLTGSDTSVFAQKYVTPLCRCCSFVWMKFPAQDDNIRRIRKAFDRMEADTPGYEFDVRDALSRIVLAAWSAHREDIRRADQVPDNDAVRIAGMLDFIRSHYAEDITLHDISHAVHIGDREALRCFRRTIGESPMQYLLRYRLMQSADMLRSSPGRKVNEIAGRCGFNSPSYYSKKFHELYHCTPLAFARSKL